MVWHSSDPQQAQLAGSFSQEQPIGSLLLKYGKQAFLCFYRGVLAGLCISAWFALTIMAATARIVAYCTAAARDWSAFAKQALRCLAAGTKAALASITASTLAGVSFSSERIQWVLSSSKAAGHRFGTSAVALTKSAGKQIAAAATAAPGVIAAASTSAISFLATAVEFGWGSSQCAGNYTAAVTLTTAKSVGRFALKSHIALEMLWPGCSTVGPLLVAVVLLLLWVAAQIVETLLSAAFIASVLHCLCLGNNTWSPVAALMSDACWAAAATGSLSVLSSSGRLAAATGARVSSSSRLPVASSTGAATASRLLPAQASAGINVSMVQSGGPARGATSHPGAGPSSPLPEQVCVSSFTRSNCVVDSSRSYWGVYT